MTATGTAPEARGHAEGLRFRVLGPLAVVDSTQPERSLAIGPPKQRVVLALLLLQRGHVISAQRLIDAVWESDPPPSAVSSLHVYVSNLRRVLRDAPASTAQIERRTGGYVLELPASALDLTDFVGSAERAREALEGRRWSEAVELAEAALAQWRGGLLEDLREWSWVQSEGATYEELAAECRETRITAWLAEGRTAAALAAARELHADHPERDRACRLLMICLHRADRSADALEVYREHARRLDDELGLEPGPGLRELEGSILRHDPALSWWPREPGATAPGRRSGVAASPPSDPEPLIGRETERRVLGQLLADARAGRGRAIVLTGPAGIGKTRLARELIAGGRDAGGVVGRAECNEDRDAPAWWPLRQLARSLGEDPDLLLSTPIDLGADEARFAVYERIADRLRETATTAAPLVLLVEDVQWIDRTSAACLAYLAGALHDVPVAILFTLRDDEDAGAGAPLLAAIARGEGSRQLAVGPMSRGEVNALAVAVGDGALAPDELAGLHDLTGGNPLFVTEWVRLPAAERRRGELPSVVRAVVDRRLAALGPGCVEILRAVAVLGRGESLKTLAAVAECDDEHLADLLDEAAREHVVVVSENGLGCRFAHQLLREGILAGMGMMQRRRLHLRAARALAGEGDRVERRAHHLVAASALAPAAEVVEACRAAARQAAQRSDPEREAAWWNRALVASERTDAGPGPTIERDELLVAEVAALARAGRGQSILDVLDARLLDAMRADRRETAGRLAAALVRAAGTWSWAAYGDDHGPLLERLVAVERFVAERPGPHARALAALAVGHCHDPDGERPDQLSHAALARARESGDADVLADALLARIIIDSTLTAYPDVVARAEQLRALDHREQEVDSAIALGAAAQAQLSLGDVCGAARSLSGAIIEADVHGATVLRLQLRYLEGSIAQWHGDLKTAEHHLAVAGRAHEETELSHARSHVLARRVLAFQRGRLDEVGAAGTPEPLPWEAAIAAARGDRDSTREVTQRWLSTRGPWIWITLGHVVLLAHAVADTGLTEPAEELESLLAPRAGHLATVGYVGLLGPVDLARGRLRRLLGDRDGARELLQSALGLAVDESGTPWEARSREALASL